jgi:hypothetical protein
VTVPGGARFETMTSGATCFFEIPTPVSSAFQMNSDAVTVHFVIVS